MIKQYLLDRVAANDPTLERVNFSNIFLESDDIRALASALEDNSHLRILYLSNSIKRINYERGGIF
jgi:hypothetical protein